MSARETSTRSIRVKDVNKLEKNGNHHDPLNILTSADADPEDIKNNQEKGDRRNLIKSSARVEPVIFIFVSSNGDAVSRVQKTVS